MWLDADFDDAQATKDRLLKPPMDVEDFDPIE